MCLSNFRRPGVHVNDSLFETVLERLLAATELDERVGSLVLAACEGEEPLRCALAENAATRSREPRGAARVEPVGAYLQSLSVCGFRGIGKGVALPLTPGPGLTLVVGRNGSGKSSFAEGLEFALTGDNRRWAGRPKVWKEGWRNLHHQGPGEVRAELLVEGVAGPTVVCRSWADTESTAVFVQPHGQPQTDLSYLGWGPALSTHRPFLSYNELGSMLDEGPSKLYDAIATGLGLDELKAAQNLLRDQRSSRESQTKAVRSEAAELVRLLESSEDERAALCRDALSGKRWKLEVIEESLGSAEVTGGDEGELSLLVWLSALRPPEENRVDQLVVRLREATAKLEEVAGTESERNLRLADLLQKALDVQAGSECPVCSAALPPEWAEETRSQVSALRESAQAARAARDGLREAVGSARAILSAVPARLVESERVALDPSRVLQAWTQWSRGSQLEDPSALLEHLEASYLPLAESLEAFAESARIELRRREDAWRPLAQRLGAWLPQARQCDRERPNIAALKKAGQWLDEFEDQLRNERFAPVAEKAQSIWEMLRHQSNVSLDEIFLEGTRTRRRVVLSVTVDGVEGAALGVMSQGELTSLALSLFLPRATLPESPFRFVVIDDPVQSMDPAKVDGLARVLEGVARDRQVVVMTHDARLPEAVRRLGISATVLEVTRRGGSQVTVRPTSDPARRALQDAFALAMTENLQPQVAARVVPGFCRAALEAVLVDIVRRRRLTAGEPYAQVEALLEDTGLTRLGSLALFDDDSRGGEVRPTLSQRFGARASDTFKSLNRGAHGGYDGSVLQLVRDTEWLVREVAVL